ncbi:MAG TPA: hypothetical protein VKY31_04620 [Terriglobia bacterium]|nr:hypothetical protein [Terriglobia bacterium]
MNLAHVHIILNHVPSLGSIAGLLLLAWGIYKKDEAVKQFAYGVLVLITMAVLPTYITGAEAQLIVNKSPTYAPGMVQLHQNAAMITLLCMTAAGMFAWFGLWEIRRHARSSSLTTMATLIFTMAAVAAVLVTASIGGKISHQEIRDASDLTITEAVGWRPQIEMWINDHAWSWPTLEMIHYVGMAFLFGVSTVYLFRMIGIMKGISLKALHRLLPMAIIGFVINTITGMIFFAGAPQLYLGKVGFQIKILGIVVTTIPILYFTMFNEPWKVQADENPPATAKIAAVATFVLVVVVMIYGRFLPWVN